ncbi:MAG: serine/threonine-protein kinase [Bdellovibrionota bacterium]
MALNSTLYGANSRKAMTKKFNGRYEIIKCLGNGSMGMTYLCRHLEMAGHYVALKILYPEVARDEVASDRFRNEIVASYGVSHPNVVRAYEYFRDDDLICFTMEYIEGGDLAKEIANHTTLDTARIIELLIQICSGLKAIHSSGIIHRDIKPENILLTKNGTVKISDFGIARAGTGPRLSDHGGVVGTIDYVSPEYLETGAVDLRGDIYAVGVIAYEMITGESPFKADSVIQSMTKRLKEDAAPPAEINVKCSSALSDFTLKAMARDPEKRFQTAGEMVDALEKIAKAETVH